MNLGGGGVSELRSHHCTPAWAAEQDPISKKKERKKERKDSVKEVFPKVIPKLERLSRGRRRAFQADGEGNARAGRPPLAVMDL